METVDPRPQGLALRMGFLALHQPLTDNPNLLFTLDHDIQLGLSPEDGLTKQPRGPEPLCFGEKQ